MRLLLIIALATLIYLALKHLTAANNRDPEARSKPAPGHRLAVEPGDSLVFRNDQFFLVAADGRHLTRHLGELVSVSVLTTDQGPFADDVHLTLDFGGPLWLMAISHPEYKEFYEALTRRLSFNYEQYLQAVLSVDNNVFLVWSRADGFLHPDQPNGLVS